MGLAQLHGPDTGQRFVGGFSSGVDRLAGYAETGGGRRHEHHAAALREVWLGGLREEDRPLDVRVEMSGEELLCDLDEIGVYTQSSAAREILCQPLIALKLLSSYRTISRSGNILMD